MDVFLNILFWILAVFLLITAIALFVKIKVVINFKKQKDEDFIVNIRLHFFGGLFKREVPTKQKSDKGKKDKSEEKPELKFFEKVKKYYGDFLKFKTVYKENNKKIRKTVYAEKIHLDINFGLGDAAKTGIATGCVWAGIYNVIAFISKVIRIKEPKINVTPMYNDLSCEAGGECIITARPVNLIITAFGLYKSYKKVIKTK